MASEKKFELLTPGQTRVFALLLDGRSNRSIADALSISEATVKNHASAIYRKTGVRTRMQLVRWWFSIRNAPSAKVSA